MSKPSILLIPGSFSRPEVYDVIVNPVAAEGYEIKALHLPSVGLDSKTGREGELPTMYDDAAFIAKEITKLADDGKDVVLIAHSYGGVPTTESTRGLGKEERQKQGKKGGVVRLSYMTAVVPALGRDSASVLAEAPPENQTGMAVDDKGWMHLDIAQAASLSFSDVPKEEGEAWASRFSSHSSASFAGELTYAGYEHIPVSWLFCEEDKVVTPNIQRSEIEMIERESGNKVDVMPFKTGHVPFATVPQKVVDWILHVAGKDEVH